MWLLPNPSSPSLPYVHMSSNPSQIIEHVVLFKLKDDELNSINSMVNGINALANLDQVLNLSCGPIHRLSSSSTFTHLLHSRYSSIEDLNAYAIHPDHVRVVKESESIREDILAVDWISDHVPETLAPPPGSIGKIMLLKLKENGTEEAKLEIMETIKEKFGGTDDITFGENFSPGRAKGFSIGFISYFGDFVEDQIMLQKNKIVDETIVVEFVVPPKVSSSL